MATSSSTKEIKFELVSCTVKGQAWEGPPRSKFWSLQAICRGWKPATTHKATTFGTLSSRVVEHDESDRFSWECSFNPTDFEVDFFKTWEKTPPEEFDTDVLWPVNVWCQQHPYVEFNCGGRLYSFRVDIVARPKADTIDATQDELLQAMKAHIVFDPKNGAFGTSWREPDSDQITNIRIFVTIKTATGELIKVEPPKTQRSRTTKE